jgi:hypothetical protein
MTAAFLATSLAPGRDVALQRAAVQSWRAAGFAVLSVNAASEIPQLARDHPDVTLVAATATAEKIARKPLPYIRTLMGALRAACESGGHALADCTVGLINDDIHLRLAAGDLAEIARAAQGSVILGPRVDVADADALARFAPTGRETYSIGYDYVLMSADVMADFADSPFCLGMPFWDYWLPLMALLKGRRLFALAEPVALHIAHETRWDDGIYVFFHALIAAVLDAARTSRGRDGSAPARQFDLLFDVFGHIYADVFDRGTRATANGAPDPAGIAALAAFYDRFQEVAVHHIKTHAAPLRLAARAA